MYNNVFPILSKGSIVCYYGGRPLFENVPKYGSPIAWVIFQSTDSHEQLLGPKYLKSFSVAKALPIAKESLLLAILIICHHAHRPSYILAIVHISHHAHLPLCPSSIVPISHYVHRPICPSSIEPISHHAHQPLNPLTIMPIKLSHTRVIFANHFWT